MHFYKEMVISIIGVIFQNEDALVLYSFTVKKKGAYCYPENILQIFNTVFIFVHGSPI